MKVFLDLDGVLASFNQGALDWYGESDPYEDPANHGNYDVITQIVPKFWDGITEEFWEKLPLTPEAHDIVALVTSSFGIDNVCALTSPAHTPYCMEGKMKWILKHFPQFRRRYFFGPPKHFAAHEDALLIDDSDENVRSFQRHGGNAVLVPRPWNAAYKHRNEVLQVVAPQIAYFADKHKNGE